MIGIPIGVEGRIENSGHAGHRVLVLDDQENSGGFLILEWWAGSAGPGANGAFDAWVENSASLTGFFSESGWDVQWDQPFSPGAIDANQSA